jgi:hypothetical protein
MLVKKINRLRRRQYSFNIEEPIGIGDDVFLRKRLGYDIDHPSVVRGSGKINILIIILRGQHSVSVLKNRRCITIDDVKIKDGLDM